MFRKITIKLKDYIELIPEIYNGYRNLIIYKLGNFEESDTVGYRKKKMICTNKCPLQSSFCGVAFCDPRKEQEGEYGCGCIIEAKLWSESPCPLDKF